MICRNKITVPLTYSSKYHLEEALINIFNPLFMGRVQKPHNLQLKYVFFLIVFGSTTNSLKTNYSFVRT